MNYIKKGGVVLTDSWKSRPNDALISFIEHCGKVKILTDDSISCVTYVFYDLPPTFVSPYITTRSNNFEQPVNQILFKLGFISKRQLQPEYITCRRSSDSIYEGQIEAITENALFNEVKTQDILFKKSICDVSTPLEPICPAIICYTKSILEQKTRILNIIMSKLEERPPNYKRHRRDNIVTTNLFNITTHNMYLIVMEFMDGFLPLKDFTLHPRYEEFQDMHAYELNKMSSYGYVHGDFHFGNVMINPNYPYFTNKSSDKYYGRALIIDFGRILKLGSSEYNSWKNRPNGYGLYRPQRNYARIISRLSNNDIGKNLRTYRAAMAKQFIEGLSKNKLNTLQNSVKDHLIAISLNPPPNPVPQAGPIPVPQAVPNPVPQAVPNPVPQAKKKQGEQQEAEEKSPEIYVRKQTPPFKKVMDKFFGLFFYSTVTGNLPSQSPVFNPFNFWDWCDIYGLEFDIINGFKSIGPPPAGVAAEPEGTPPPPKQQPTPLETPQPPPKPAGPPPKPAVPSPKPGPPGPPPGAPAGPPPKPGPPPGAPAGPPPAGPPPRGPSVSPPQPEPPQPEPPAVVEEVGCPARNIVVPKCMDKTIYKKTSLKIHPDKNPNCGDFAAAKFKELGVNKDNQERTYGVLSEDSYKKCSKENNKNNQAQNAQKAQNAQNAQNAQKNYEENAQKAQKAQNAQNAQKNYEEKEQKFYNQNEFMEKMKKAKAEKARKHEEDIREAEEAAARKAEEAAARKDRRQAQEEAERRQANEEEAARRQAEEETARRQAEEEAARRQAEELINYYNQIGNNLKTSIFADFENIINNLGQIARLENQIVENADKITIENYDQYRMYIISTKQASDDLLKNIMGNIAQLREIMKSQATILRMGNYDEIINGLIESWFRDYQIRIEDLLRCIFTLESQIDEQIAAKRKAEAEARDIFKPRPNVWFGIPPESVWGVQPSNEINFGAPSNKINFGAPRQIQFLFGGNNDIIQYQEINTFSYIPVFGIKYEIATENVNFLVEKYNLGQLEIKNENIDDLLFKQYIDEEFKQPFLLEFKNIGGKKISSRKTKKKRKTMKRNKKNKTKRK